jgi:hypothetical protein
VDLLWLPRRHLSAFCGLATGPYARVFHEVAIPTIANLLAAPPVEHIPCAGSCCSGVTWDVALRHVCAHRVELRSAPAQLNQPPISAPAHHTSPALQLTASPPTPTTIGAAPLRPPLPLPRPPPPPKKHQPCQRLTTPFQLESAWQVVGTSCAGCSNVLYNPPGVRDAEISASLRTTSAAQQRGRRRLPPISCKREQQRSRFQHAAAVAGGSGDSDGRDGSGSSDGSGGGVSTPEAQLLLWQPQFANNFGEVLIRLPEVGCLLANETRTAWRILVPLDFTPPRYLAQLLAPFGTLVVQAGAAGQRFRGGALCCWPWGPREWLSAFQITEWRRDALLRCGTRRRVLAHYGVLTTPLVRPARVLFVRRTGAHRVLLNLDELVAHCNREQRMRCLAAEFGTLADGQPFAERLQLLRSSHGLVGLHGAALTNAVFMHRGALAIEIFACAFGMAHVVKRRGWGSANDFLQQLVEYRQVLVREADPACAHARSDEERRDCNLTVSWEEDVAPFVRHVVLSGNEGQGDLGAGLPAARVRCPAL